MSDKLTELKGLLTEIVGGQTAEIKEKLDEQKASFEEQFGKVEDRLTELENKGIPTARKPQLMDVTVPGAPAGEAKQVYMGYNLKMQGAELKWQMNNPQNRDILTQLYPVTTIADDAHREEYAKFLIDVIRAKQGDPHAMMKLADAREKALMAEGAGSTGGYLVPEEFTNELLAFARLQSLALRHCRVWPMSEMICTIPIESTGVSVAWTAEGIAATESEPTVSEVTLTAKKLDAFGAVTNELLADSAIDIVSWLTQLFAEAIGQELDNQVFNGSGTPCSGVLTAACGYSVVMSETNFSSISGTYLSQMISRLSANKRSGARFFAEKTVLHYIRTLKDTNNQFLFAQIGGQVPGTIWGFPYDETEKITGTTAANTAFLSFGDLRYFCLGRRLQTTTLDLDPYTYFKESKTQFRIVNRWGMSIGLSTAFVRLLTHS